MSATNDEVATTSQGVPDAYNQPEGQRTLAHFLKNGVKTKNGIQHEKRVEYFKGKKLIEAILEAKKWPKSLPKVTDRGVALQIAAMLLQANFFHKSEKNKDRKGTLQIAKRNVFEEGGYYTWMISGNMTWSHIATGAVMATILGFTLLPIWPDAAKRVLWYCSVTFLISTLAFCLVRFLLFLLLWLFGYEFWIFPRLFDESLSFQDSFKPFYSFEKAAPGQGYYRIGLLVALAAFVYWACTQPTEFDGFLKAQKDFLDDIYSGNLLADVSQEQKMNIDRTKRVPDLEDLLREIAEEDRISATAHEPSVTDDVSASSDSGSDKEDEGTQMGDDALDDILRKQELEDE